MDKGNISSNKECIANNLKNLSVQQDECVNKVKEIMDKLDSSQLTVEKNAFDAINSSDNSLNLVKEGMLQVDDLSTKYNELVNAVEKSSKNISQMHDLSNMVAGFAKVITGISGKTNMLSLNASIEAARAGEHGLGFAVVAKQVRDLAEQSAKSSKEISETITTIQEFVNQIIDEMKELFTIIEKQNEVVSNVGGLFEKILDAAYVSNDVSRTMEHEIAYQRDITEDVKKAIVKMGKITDDTVETIQEL